jgi:hypothetical protein
MQSGDYGLIEDSILEKYRNECHRLWPQANIFQTDPPPTFDQSRSPPPSYSSTSAPPPPYSSCDDQINGSNNEANSNN